MWAEPQFVRGLVRAIQSQPDVVSAGAKILNWDGTRFDFAGSGSHFSGYAFQAGYNLPFDPDHFNEVEPILFACAGAMMIDRQVFLEAGGFDDGYFIYFEDADLGWRLWLLGHRVVFAPEAVVYHRHHGTMDSFSLHRKQVLFKRNSLYTIIKNYRAGATPMARSWWTRLTPARWLPSARSSSACRRSWRSADRCKAGGGAATPRWPNSFAGPSCTGPT
jgi:GT2 family glycosyltransferase